MSRIVSFFVCKGRTFLQSRPPALGSLQVAPLLYRLESKRPMISPLHSKQRSRECKQKPLHVRYTPACPVDAAHVDVRQGPPLCSTPAVHARTGLPRDGHRTAKYIRARGCTSAQPSDMRSNPPGTTPMQPRVPHGCECSGARSNCLAG